MYENALVANSIRNQLMGAGGIAGQDNIAVLWSSFGYKLQPSYKDYYRLYRRQGLAQRIINANIDFTWKELPSIIDEAEDANKKITDTPGQDEYKTKRNMRYNIGVRLSSDEESYDVPYTNFEEAIYQLFKKFSLFRILKKADRLNCIGRYSVLVIGAKNDLKLTTELPKGMSLDDIAYFSVFSEEQAVIQQWETDRSNERFGLPKIYQITASEEGGQSLSYQVHHSRIIHIAEDLIDSEVYGLPKLEGVYNDLQDILKVVGGSAEMFWLGAYQGIVFNVKDDFKLDVESSERMSEEIQNYVDKLQRFIKTKGVDVTTLSSPTADPRGNFEVLLKIISSASNIPVRILIGSEQGQLSSKVDQNTFISYINARRNGFVNESILRQLIDRLVSYGYMPNAKNNEYYIVWPSLFEQDQTEQITNMKLMVETATTAVGAGGSPTELITPEEIREGFGLKAEIPDTRYPDIGVSSLSDYDFSGSLDSLPNYIKKYDTIV